MATTLRTLSPLNTNYDPPRPWTCATHEPHQCDGVVVGAVGAIPVCAAGATAQETAYALDRQRIDRWAAENADLLAAESRAEMAFERRANAY